MKHCIEELTYAELLKALQEAKPGKDMRRIHKALKQYGDKVMLLDRYPYWDYMLGFALGVFAAICILIATK